ncbi:SHUGOSHIN 1 isoform X2 [Mercurialis annua]|uniref:SHUGOSHIN 1 isoform X2 n=1 Tax=Mercurialis annua TaxID=3986 RepID=UPI00215F095E|nr:SHUGOSHIN 1 isoform X2 [Mercurialis annua]
MDGGEVSLLKENHNVNNKVKGQEIAKASTVVGDLPRKTLGDISNLPQKNQDMKPPSVSVNAKDYIHKLHQENLTLVKLLTERNKIIQSHAFELQKLKTQCQHVQQKNLELAQSNSQIMAELNTNKDRLRVLQHELGCKNSLLKVSKLQYEENDNTGDTIRPSEVDKVSEAENRDNELSNKRRKQQSKSLDLTTLKPVEAKEKTDKRRKCAKLKGRKHDSTDDAFEITKSLDLHMDEPIEAEKKVDVKRLSLRRQSSRFIASEQATADDSFQINDALDPTTVTPHQAENKADNKRLCSRRQSARLRSREVQELTEDTFQIDDDKFPVSPLNKSDAPTSVSAVKSEPEVGQSTSGSEAPELGRLSFRPKRQVAEKVQSYKETSLNVKMRRPT